MMIQVFAEAVEEAARSGGAGVVVAADLTYADSAVQDTMMQRGWTFDPDGSRAWAWVERGEWSRASVRLFDGQVWGFCQQFRASMLDAVPSPTSVDDVDSIVDTQDVVIMRCDSDDLGVVARHESDARRVRTWILARGVELGLEPKVSLLRRLRGARE